jgi:uncharacterized protein
MSENGHQVSRVIALEEHVWTPELRAALLKFGGDDTVTTFSNEEKTNQRLLDVGEERLTRMDAAGVDFQVLSITAPGTQQLPPALAVPLARDANDFLADAVQRRPDRFAAFATLPTPDPEAAADELRRCVTELKFVGAMLFPRTGPNFLDHSSFRPIFEVAAELKVPLYIHPGVPPEAVREACYGDFGFATNLMLSTGGVGLARRGRVGRAAANPRRNLRPPSRPTDHSRPLGRDARLLRRPSRCAHENHPP